MTGRLVWSQCGWVQLTEGAAMSSAKRCLSGGRATGYLRDSSDDAAVKHETPCSWSRLKTKRPVHWTGRLNIQSRPTSGEDCLEDQEENYRQSSANRQRNQPGGEDLADNPQVQCADAARETDAQHGTDQCMSSGYRQAQGRCGDYGSSRGQLCSEAAAGGQLGDFPANSGNHLVTIGGKTDDDTEGAQQQYPAWDGGLGPDGHVATGLDRTDHRCQRPDGIGHVVGAMGERHGTGRENHQNSEDLFDTGEMECPIGLFVNLDAGQQRHAEQCHNYTHGYRKQQA